ncbi:MAG: dTDP-4-dehydrorhamnose reductase [Fibrobacteres bacterium]|nr:dTDP-4-dehydrorhamnose reductase [Fibrobacterota bacterium]
MVQSLGSPSRINEYTAETPILVLGLPGVPGFNAFFNLRALYPGLTLGAGPPNAPELTAAGSPFGPGIVAADPENPRELAALFEAHDIKTVLDASGWCALKSCEFDPALARRLNVDIGRHAMEEARRRGARLIRLSTDLVFDGNPYVRDGRECAGGYREDSPVSPVTVYGKMMAEAESIIMEGYPEAAILRIALPMGPSLNGHAGAVDWIESRFRKGKPATLYYDEVRSNLYVQDLNRVLAHFCGNDARGIWHVGGPRPLSLYQVAQVINRLGNYPPELLMGCPRAAAGPMPPRAGDVGMNTDKLTAALPPGTLRPWPADETHVPTDREWHARREADFPSGAVARHLYGDGWPGAWDHPIALVPGAGD